MLHAAVTLGSMFAVSAGSIGGYRFLFNQWPWSA